MDCIHLAVDENILMDWRYSLVNGYDQSTYLSGNSLMDQFNEYRFYSNANTLIANAIPHVYRTEDEDELGAFVVFMADEADEPMLKKIEYMLGNNKIYYSILVLVHNTKKPAASLDSLKVDLIIRSNSIVEAYKDVIPVCSAISKQGPICVDSSDLKYGISPYGKTPIIAHIPIALETNVQFLLMVTLQEYKEKYPALFKQGIPACLLVISVPPQENDFMCIGSKFIECAEHAGLICDDSSLIMACNFNEDIGELRALLSLYLVSNN